MTNSWNKETLKTFIKDTLGCGCPNRVFEKIDIEKHLVKGYSKELTRIVVGDTLLIYLADSADQENFNYSIEVIGMAGKNDRDLKKYNRFRLVVATAESGDQSKYNSDRFSRVFGSDEKMHIHFVSHESIDKLSI